MTIKLNDNYIRDFVDAREIHNLSSMVATAAEQLRSGTGAGNDFLGWVDLPEQYDKEEFERINDRFNYLTDQKVDIVNSINNLMSVINDLDETMKEKFIETFNKVNIEFNKVFKKLFKGGNGELHLTEPDDILNTGIDITACPPGKSLKNINLLSGGEKTLTAIALLFAIINIRYVPFCILDEVEAALDEANVDMFGNYIMTMIYVLD